MSSKLLLAVSSGRNLLKATIKLSGPQGVNFRFQDSALDGGESHKVSKSHG